MKPSSTVPDALPIAPRSLLAERPLAPYQTTEIAAPRTAAARDDKPRDDKPRDEIPAPNALAIRALLNGETVQNSDTRDIIFDVLALPELLSADSTLLPDTVILTGTPEGVGMGRKPPVYLKDGDRVTIEIEGIGALSNAVEAAASGAEASS